MGNSKHIAAFKAFAQLAADEFHTVRRQLPREQQAKAMDAVLSANAAAMRDLRAELPERPDLSGADFASLVFYDLAFEKANLKGTNFAGALVRQCKFTHSNLQGAYF